MPTQKQIDANRLNAEKSSGQRTPSGKAVSSMNALKSGVDARSHLIRGKRRTDLETLTAGSLPALPPRHFRRTSLRRHPPIRDDWQLRRLAKVDAEIWEHEMDSAYRL